MLIATVLGALTLMLLGLNIVFYSKNGPQCTLGMLLTIVGLFLMLMSPALAQHSGHRAQDMDLHHKFYKTWRMPDNRTMSCCNDQDCAPAQSRRGPDGQWQSRHSDDEEWIDIPARKVEQDRDSPDGQSHLCKLKSFHGTYVYCFLPAAGG